MTSKKYIQYEPIFYSTAYVLFLYVSMPVSWPRIVYILPFNCTLAVNHITIQMRKCQIYTEAKKKVCI